MLAVSGPVHAVRCESISQANEVLFFGSPKALTFVVHLQQWPYLFFINRVSGFTEVFCNPGFVSFSA